MYFVSHVEQPEVVETSHQVLNELVMLEKSFKKDLEIICIVSSPQPD